MLSVDLDAILALDPAKKLTAAIRSDFDPRALFETDSLLNHDGVGLVDAMAGLCREVEVGGARRHWSMRTAARRAVLENELVDERHLEVVAGVEIPPEDRFGSYLKSALLGVDISTELPDPGSNAIADPSLLVEANAMLRALRLSRTAKHDWHSEADRHVRRFIAAAEADRALIAVVPPRLIGRKRELDHLMTYRLSELPTDSEWVPTCIVTGPGGAGKSALVSRFVLDERHRSGAAPVVYLDFDKASLIDASPVGLTFELTRQFGHFDAEVDERLDRFRDLSRDLGRDKDASDVDGGSGTAFDVYRELSSVLADWRHRQSRVLVVLDTFEELAGRGSTAVMDVLQWLRSLRDHGGLTQLHAIVSGREVIPDAPHLPDGEAESWFAAESRLRLGDLDPAGAAELLEELGVTSQHARRLSDVFGGNPLVLKMVSRYIEGNTTDQIEELLDGSENERAPVGEVGLRFVYRRFLERVRGSVKALAYPGIAVRRVTPEVVLEVLAPEMGEESPISSLKSAKQAFDELASHVWLVSRVDDDTVIHRRDTRRLLVPGLESDPGVNTEVIHRRAVRYYERRPHGVPAEVAELEAGYHRGFLHEVPTDEREAAQLLRRLGPDLAFWPTASRARLRSIAGFHNELTEEEVLALEWSLQSTSRAARMEQRRSKGDLAGAGFEAFNLTATDVLDESPERIAYLYEIGDFEFITDGNRVRRMIERYLVDGIGQSRQTRTYHHPWLMASACRMVDRMPERLLSDLSLDWLARFGRQSDSGRYALAVAGLAGDLASYRAALEALKVQVDPLIDDADDLLELQAIGLINGGPKAQPTEIRVPSLGHLRFDRLAAVVDRFGSPGLRDVVTSTLAEFRLESPMSTQINAFRQTLVESSLTFDGLATLRSAPVVTSFLYAPIRTATLSLARREQQEIIDILATRSTFWPQDQLGATFVNDQGRSMSSREVGALVETADRCGLIIELADLLDARARTDLSAALAVGVRRIESTLFT